jgi:hypothetical protein
MIYLCILFRKDVNLLYIIKQFIIKNSFLGLSIELIYTKLFIYIN